MAMTSQTIAPTVAPNPGSAAEKAQVKASVQDELTALLDQVTVDVKNDLNEQESKEKIAAQLKQAMAGGSPKALQDLTEDDAYNYDVAIAAPASYSPDFMRVILKDKNYIARWCHVHQIMQAKRVTMGFRKVKLDECENKEELEMFVDSRGDIVTYDLVVMKMLKSVYYAGIRRAHLKSLQATNARGAAQAGAAFAASNLTSSLSGAERGYMSAHDLTEKPIYSPTIGV